MRTSPLVTGALWLALLSSLNTAVGCSPAMRSSKPLVATFTPLPVPPDSESWVSVGPPAPPAGVGVTATLSHLAYTGSNPERLFLKVDFVASEGSAADRPPLDIALVLDHSGSMEEDDKLAYALEAAHWVIQNMSERDRLSIVAFNDEVRVLAEAAPVNRSFLTHRLDEIEPHGRTDISAGLLEGVAQVRRSSEVERVRHVLLLSDGLANVGVTQPEALAEMAAVAHAGGVSISTLGLGIDFDPRALAGIAQAGAGRYTYVESAEQLPLAFAQELRGLLEVVAQNVRLRVTVGGALITGTSFETLDAPLLAYEVELGNVRAREVGTLILAIEPQQFEAGASVTYRVELIYDDPPAAERFSIDAAGQAVFAPDGDLVPIEANEEVLMYAGILAALDSAELALQSGDLDTYRAAGALIQQWYNRAYDFAVATQDRRLLENAVMLQHFMDEFAVLASGGGLHEHDDARRQLTRRSHYQRYLLTHHRDDDDDDH